MDLSDKQIKITTTATTAYPANTLVECQILADLGNGLRQVVSTFELSFASAYDGPSDPALMAAIVERLEAV